LFAVPSSSMTRRQRRVDRSASRPITASAISVSTWSTACSTPLPPYRSPPSRSSVASNCPVAPRRGRSPARTLHCRGRTPPQRSVAARVEISRPEKCSMPAHVPRPCSQNDLMRPKWLKEKCSKSTPRRGDQNRLDASGSGADGGVALDIVDLFKASAARTNVALELLEPCSELLRPRGA